MASFRRRGCRNWGSCISKRPRPPCHLHHHHHHPCHFNLHLVLTKVKTQHDSPQLWWHCTVLLLNTIILRALFFFFVCILPAESWTLPNIRQTALPVMRGHFTFMRAIPRTYWGASAIHSMIHYAKVFNRARGFGLPRHQQMALLLYSVLLQPLIIIVVTLITAISTIRIKLCVWLDEMIISFEIYVVTRELWEATPKVVYFHV